MVTAYDIPPDELDLPLAHEAHQSLNEIDARIAGRDWILDARVDKYPVALPMGKILPGTWFFCSDSY